MSQKVSEQLRTLVNAELDAGFSLKSVCELSGVRQSTLSKFVHGANVRCDVIDKLCELFQLDLSEPVRLIEG